jgi:hypothetical protein
MHPNQGLCRERSKKTSEVPTLIYSERVRWVYPYRKGVGDDGILLRSEERAWSTQSEYQLTDDVAEMRKCGDDEISTQPDKGTEDGDNFVKYGNIRFWIVRL